ncbi:MAG TPA: hypothetical protein VF137_11145 [Candidatus Dormibacteraeota bacterium]
MSVHFGLLLVWLLFMVLVVLGLAFGIAFAIRKGWESGRPR